MKPVTYPKTDTATDFDSLTAAAVYGENYSINLDRIVSAFA